jgi:rubrerythrin
MKALRMSLGVITMVILGLISTAAATPRSRTLGHLQVAFNGESNAHARYLAFADKAAQEGYGEVASLFRAAARAEEIHAANHAVVIRKLGGEPHANIETPVVKSTRENLKEAIKGESYERDVMYPKFIRQARAAGIHDAVVTFTQARTAEAEHAKLYGRALMHLARLKGSKSLAFYVCPTCGYTVREVNFANCPSCMTPREAFEPIL